MIKTTNIKYMYINIQLFSTLFFDEYLFFINKHIFKVDKTKNFEVNNFLLLITDNKL